MQELTNDMKLEITHLAPYLPYKLKIKVKFLKKKDVAELDSIFLKDVNGKRRTAIGVNGGWCYIETIKPILRPLSDLDKEINLNDKTFVPWLEIMNRGRFKFVDGEEIVLNIKGLEKLNNFSLSDSKILFDTLFEWHFDVFGLIPKGLAIDVNTIG